MTVGQRIHRNQPEYTLGAEFSIHRYDLLLLGVACVTLSMFVGFAQAF